MLIVKNNIENIDSLIADLEKKIKLPDEYKNFIQKYNGGETPNTSFSANDVSSDIREFYSIEDILSIFEKGTSDLVKENKLLPIACDSFGNQFVIEVSEPYSVYFIDHEKLNSQTKIAESFSEFIGICKSGMINEKAIKTPEEREKALIDKGKGANISEGLREMWRQEYSKYCNLDQEEVVF